MKSILISIKPRFVDDILDLSKTIEIRKTAPKCDLPIDVYVYCTEPHAKEVLSLFAADVRPNFGGRVAEFIERKRVDNPNMRWSICNGKVVAKFTLRKVEEIWGMFSEWVNKFDVEDELYLCLQSCLYPDEIEEYLTQGKYNNNDYAVYGYAWHIDDLVIFDRPKDLFEFGLTKAPQSWQYVEKGE